MLLGLRLHNIALIESINLSFEQGFSVFTGETGAGKSVFLSAIDSLLGGGSIGSGSRLMRSGTSNCLIEGCFSIDSNVKNWLEENSFEINEQEFFVSRDWKITDGRLTSRIRLNGEIINKKQILTLRPRLIDLAEQGQSHQLNSSTYQLQLLDRFGSDEIDKATTLVKTSWNQWLTSKKELEEIKIKMLNIEDELLKVKAFLLDLETIKIENPLEEVELKEEQDRLVHGVKLQDALLILFNRLKDSTDEFPTVHDHFSICIQELKTIAKLDPSQSIHLDILLDLYNKLDDFLVGLEDYRGLLDTDPAKLDLIQNRLADINKLKVRYNLDYSNLILKRDQSLQLLEKSSIDDEFNDLEEKEKLCKLDLETNCLLLSKIRKKYAGQLEENLVNYLKPLGLEHIQFKVDFSPSPFSQIGSDAIEFLFSANPGVALAPLADIASGGERSRFLLALTTVFADVSGSSTLIFDEIDAGVSGRISAAISKLLKNLSFKKQVFCITHQPLVAALADNHFSVLKIINDGMTNSKILLLKDFKDRQEELAKLAGGNFAQANEYAASLLANKAA
ncbi:MULTISPECIES: DNA repair protein RecN [Prochlorococcus]|uniref:DNA repair protein RecN n=1 Tax=Prochlorococcus marinus (strain SARG / CCMP1375 / SS120) TaxID=167539 RepID=Q7V9F1_PROMA|nr:MULTISPECIES: AAA family ATPase [Prochlorococcus]AAQ00926.1 ATPase [Prochlorococcus marinus subsp. marinus str. CCMP1375]KGG10461.1 DNA repair protein RecN [Prochlorococcus marinus str. LG]KGG20232.1 DNA repair protein RecN [Prochlorococcus marinus str. SS2]KGG23825.1 DNA repair protein RecN [Prochlorococcus marinus str. SS35]KGG33092.1 DNA repair protein RecN [Prochlorococcus marinus str. SS51]